MSAVRNRDTGPELMLRRELHRRGLRYRIHGRIFGRPDIVFARPKVALFVDGDYFHGNTWRLRGAASFEEYTAAQANPEFWRTKIAGNMARDREVTQRLTDEGWLVIRVWESDVRADLTAVAGQVEQAVRQRRSDRNSA
jgi:DNA mismatch endonuclease (patch repair protein)